MNNIFYYYLPSSLASMEDEGSCSFTVKALADDAAKDVATYRK